MRRLLAAVVIAVVTVAIRIYELWTVHMISEEAAG